MSAVPSAEENVPDEQESEKHKSENNSNEKEDCLEVNDSISKGETKLEESSGDILTVHEAAARIAVA